MTGGRYIGTATIAANCERARINAQRQLNETNPILTALERAYYIKLKRLQQHSPCTIITGSHCRPL